MAKPKYKKGNAPRTPEEHRRILQEIDALQVQRSAQGVAKSKKRLENGMSSTSYKKSKKGKKEQRDKIYDLGRYARE